MSQNGRSRSLLQDLGWGLRKFGLYVFIMAAVALLPSDERARDQVGNLEAAGIIAAVGLIISVVLGLLRPQADRGDYWGAAIAGGAAGAAVIVIGIAALAVFGSPGPLWPWSIIVVVIWVALGALLGLIVRSTTRAGDRAKRGEPPLIYTVLRSRLPQRLWAAGRELLLLATCVILVPALLCLFLDLGGSVDVTRSTFEQMVPLGGALYVMIQLGRALGK